MSGKITNEEGAVMWEPPKPRETEIARLQGDELLKERRPLKKSWGAGPGFLF